jgi:lysozyme
MSILNGIDVSHMQGQVDWNAAKQAGIAFAFAKATEGITYTDPQFQTNWAAMQAAGLTRGAYHFYRTNDDPVQQAQNFLNSVAGLTEGDLAPVVDIEVSNGNYGSASIAANLQTWIDTVSKALGRTPIIYTNTSFWNECVATPFPNNPLWIAEYGVSAPTLPSGWSQWTFWQYSQSGTVAGVSGSVDLDYMQT